MPPRAECTRVDHVVNPQNPATWLKPDEPLIGADGRDWSWAYVLFRDIPEFPGYKASSEGEIWSCWKKVSSGTASIESRITDQWHRRVVRQVLTDRGYFRRSIGLRHESGRTQLKVLSHFILAAFVGPRPDGMQACHFPDPDPRNNRPWNLMWGTQATNYSHRTIHGTDCRGLRAGTTRVTREQLDRMKAMFASGMNRNQIAKKEGLKWDTVDIFLKFEPVSAR